MSKQFQLTESHQMGNPKIDADQGVIVGVKVLGHTSKNGLSYPIETRRKAHILLENARVNINHPDKKQPNADTPLQSRFGKLVNLREQEDGTYADLHYLTKHWLAPQIVEAAQRMPDVLGLSINGLGTGGKKDPQGRVIIESVDKIRSVDLVSDGATVRSLFESENKMPDEVTETQEVNLQEQEQSWKEEYERLKAEKSCRQLCESMSVEPEEMVMEVLTALPTEEKRKSFLSWQKAKSVAKKPRSSDTTQLRESEAKMDETNKTKHYLEILRS